MFNQIAKEIARKLAQAGVQAQVITNRDGSICVDAECDVTARDVLGMKRFRDYYNEVEVTII